jgi:hypothetical protein
MDPDHLIIVVLAVEVLTIALLAVIARAGAHPPSPSDVIRCSLLESDPGRSCERECSLRRTAAR